MGQYFLFVCPQRKEYIHPWSWAGTAKECEILSDKLFLKAIGYLLTRTTEHGGGDLYLYNGEELTVKGSWWGYSVMIVGDYDKSKRYRAAMNEYTEISRDMIFEMCKVDAFLTPDEIDRLLREYDGDDNKKIRQALHIAMTYSKRFWGHDSDARIMRPDMVVSL